MKTFVPGQKGLPPIVPGAKRIMKARSNNKNQNKIKKRKSQNIESPPVGLMMAVAVGEHQRDRLLMQ